MGALVTWMPGFPYHARADGSCEKLVGGRCSVYETRPAICRVDVMAERSGIARQVFYELNAAACNSMIRAAGLSDKYLVDVQVMAAGGTG